MKLNEIANIYIGLTKSRCVIDKPNENTSEHYYITIKDMNKSNVLDVSNIDKYHFLNKTPKTYLLHEYDILFNLYPSYSNFIILDKDLFDSYVQQNIAIIRLRDEYKTKKWIVGFLSYLLEKKKNYIKGLSVGSLVAFIKLPFLKELDIPDDLFTNNQYEKIGNINLLKQEYLINNNKKNKLIVNLYEKIGDINE